MAPDVEARNLQLVREYREAFASFDPDRYTPYLAPEPTYHAGMTKRVGQQAFHQNTGAGRVLYPHGALRSDEVRVVAEGDWVAALIEREAVTNKGEHYENIYGMFYEVRDGRIATQVELMDFRVSTDKFDLSALGPELRVPGEQVAPAAVASVPDERAPADGASTAGTSIVKVEQLGVGDDTRAWGPPSWGEVSAAFASANRNKRAIAVDLNTPTVSRSSVISPGAAMCSSSRSNRERSTDAASVGTTCAWRTSASCTARSRRSGRPVRSAMGPATTRSSRPSAASCTSPATPTARRRASVSARSTSAPRCGQPSASKQRLVNGH